MVDSAVHAINERIADVVDVYNELGGMVAAGAFDIGMMMGIKLALEHRESARGILDYFFATPHTADEAAGFYAHYDYIAEGKEPA
jgi:hypothetical protein